VLSGYNYKISDTALTLKFMKGRSQEETLQGMDVESSIKEVKA